MAAKRYDPRKLERLNDPARQETFPVKKIIGLLNIKKPEVIIDLGAGTGFFSIPFAKKFKNCKIYACDISPIMVEWMKKNIVLKYGNILPLKMKDSAIPLEDGIADFLFMVNLHHELYYPEKTLKECLRLLKSKGKIAISDWKKEKTEHGPPMEIRYMPEKVEKQLQAAGFVKIKIQKEIKTHFLITAEKP